MRKILQKVPSFGNFFLTNVLGIIYCEVKMIYITGDTHGFNDIDKLVLNKTLASLTENDYLLITGDFGGIWDGGTHDEDILDYYAKKPYTTLFIDGNHENFDLLNSYPVVQWNGGKIHRINSKVIHLMRGQIFNIENMSIFAFGGALSIDKVYRTLGISWWPEEEPSEEECTEAMENLEKNGFIVDYIVSHAAPESIVRNEINNAHKLLCLDCEAEKFLDKVLEKAVYRRWYCGHYHFDMDITDCRLSVLYQNVLELKSGRKVK